VLISLLFKEKIMFKSH